MTSRTVVIRNPNGIHARHARRFVEAAIVTAAAVRLRKGNRVADGRSILALLTLGMKCHDTVTLEADTTDEQIVARLVVILAHPGDEQRPGV